MNTLRLKYTANFKRDYVAGAALVIFFIIVAAEIALAISLPLYMNQEAALAVSVRRLRLMETFDGTRSRAMNLKLKDETARAEAMLLVWNLDLMADYLRRYSKHLSGDELAILQQQLNEMDASVTRLSRGTPFSREHKLDCTSYLKMILKKSGAENVR